MFCINLKNKKSDSELDYILLIYTSKLYSRTYALKIIYTLNKVI